MSALTRITITRSGIFSLCVAACGLMVSPSLLSAQCSGGGGGGGGSGGGGRMGGGSLGGATGSGSGGTSGTTGMSFSPQMMNTRPQVGASAGQAMAGFVDPYDFFDGNGWQQPEVTMDDMIAARREALRMARLQERRAAARARARLAVANGTSVKKAPFSERSRSTSKTSSSATKVRTSSVPSQSSSLSKPTSVSKTLPANQPSSRTLASSQ